MDLWLYLREGGAKTGVPRETPDNESENLYHILEGKCYHPSWQGIELSPSKHWPG